MPPPNCLESFCWISFGFSWKKGSPSFSKVRVQEGKNISCSLGLAEEVSAGAILCQTSASFCPNPQHFRPDPLTFDSACSLPWLRSSEFEPSPGAAPTSPPCYAFPPSSAAQRAV